VTVESAADRAAYIADFGVTVAWKVGAAAPVSGMALFDNGTIPQAMQDTIAAQNTRGTLTLRTADVPSGAGDESDVITINAVTFRPKALLPDGTGMTVVTLEQDEA
jgi:hypothetical protein